MASETAKSQATSATLTADTARAPSEILGRLIANEQKLFDRNFGMRHADLATTRSLDQAPRSMTSKRSLPFDHVALRSKAHQLSCQT